MTRRSVAAILATLALALSAGLAPAGAQATSILIATPGAYLSPTYGQPATVALVGGELTFVNIDVQRHDVQAVQQPGQYAPVQCPSSPGICNPATPSWCMPDDPSTAWTPTGGSNDLPFSAGTCPIFWSRLIGVTTGVVITPVLGMQYLTSGRTYDFLCSIHRNMRGTLVAI